MDALSAVLRAVRLSGAFFFDVHARAPWVAETPQGCSVVDAMFPGSDHLICYHLLIEGTCWVEMEGEQPLRLEAGDIVVLPQGDTHVLTTELGMRKSPLMSMYRRPDTGGVLPSRIQMGTAPEHLLRSAFQRLHVIQHIEVAALQHHFHAMTVQQFALRGRCFRVGRRKGAAYTGHRQSAQRYQFQPAVRAQQLLQQLPHLLRRHQAMLHGAQRVRHYRCLLLQAG